MLNDEVIDRLSDRLVKRMEEGNEYVLQEIGKKIKQIKSLSSTDAQKIANILKYGGDYEKIANKLSKITKLNKKDIYKIFEEVAKKDYRFAKQFYDYRDIKYIPYDNNTELKRLVRSIADRTAMEYVSLASSKNLGIGYVNKNNKVVIKHLKEAYYDIIDEAILNVSTGKETFDTMIRKSLKQIDRGLKVIYDSTYIGKDGKEHHYTRNVYSAIRQNMTDGISALQQEMQKQVGEQFKSDGVEITVVYNPAPDHALVQGKQFSNEQFSNFQNDKRATSYDGVTFEPEFKGHDRRSIGQYNCRHVPYSIILGVNIPQYTNKQLKEINDRNEKGFTYEGKHYTNYEGSQLQRRLENEIRKSKVEQISARARDDEDSINEYQHKVDILTSKYKKLCSASDLTPRNELLSVSGYHKVKV